jgi:hypothetical protein
MAGIERQPLGEVPTDEIVLIAKTTPVVRGQQQARVVDAPGGEHPQEWAYHDAVTAAAYRNDAVHASTRKVDSDLGSSCLQQETHV